MASVNRKRTQAARNEQTHTAASTAHILTGSRPGSLLISIPTVSREALVARVSLMLDSATLERAIRTRQVAVVVFENGDPRLPIVTGLIQPTQSANPFAELLSGPKQHAEKSAGEHPLEARVDGEHVVLQGAEQITLSCGKASITLQRDGKVILRGAYVETHSKGLNRIKGAIVKIN